MVAKTSDSIDWPWLVSVGVRMAGIILIGMFFGAALDAFLALIGGGIPITDDWAYHIESAGKTFFQLTALAIAILYGILSAR